MKALERLFARRNPKEEIVGVIFGRMMMELALETNRQIGALIDRRGEVAMLLVGDANGLPMAKQWKLDRASGKMRGLRLVRAAVNQKRGGIENEDEAAINIARLDMAAVLIPPKRGEASDLIRVEYAYPKPEAETNECFYSEPVLLHELDVDFLALMSALEEEFSRNSKASKSASGRERAFLVGTSVKSMADAKLSVEELENLCDTAGMLVVGSVIQARDKFDPKFLIGSGKLKEILLEAARLQAELLVFDRELSPSQLAAISDETDLSVLDRTMVILDIFAQHARTRDGKLQVELAQLKYRMPRLGSKAKAFSRLVGRIGGRGPGETKLEIDRRRSQERVRRLEKELELLSKRREVQRSARRANKARQVSIVGYTNAGKSTLLNALTGSDVYVADKLFATLEPIARRLRLKSGREVVAADTVGFIQRLPDELKTAFKATLEEISFASLLLHVVDASNPNRESMIEAVDELLEELKFGEIKSALIFNKIDRLSEEERAELMTQFPRAVFVSAVTREGLEDLLLLIDDRVFAADNLIAGLSELKAK